jgi:hypothetical protein
MRGIVTALLLAAAMPAAAAQAVAVSVEELARQSDAVVRGRVLDTTARRTPDGTRIYTVVELRRDATLRGRAPARFRVNVPGGVVGRLGQRVDGVPAFARGEDVVLFLERTGEGVYRVAALSQGKFTVAGRVARPDLSHLAFVRTSVPPRERRVEEMPLAELEQRVRTPP